MNRNITLDVMRSLAIFLMVIFHFIFDLRFLGFIESGIPDGEGWKQFRWVIISLFFLCLGCSLHYAHKTEFNGKKFFKRFAQISLSALLISVVSYLTIRENWIFFGVLHFLALSSLLVICFIRKPLACALVGLTIVVIGALQTFPPMWPWDAMFEQYLPYYTNDFVAIFPWLGVVFLGVTLSHTSWFTNDPLKHMECIQKYQDIIVWPGKHSLSIYLIHQPLLLGVLAGINALL